MTIHRSAPWTLPMPLLVLALILAPAAGRAADGTTRSFASGSYVLELQGTAVGALRDASGGEPCTHPVSGGSSGPYVNKHPGIVKYDDIVLQVGPGMEPAFYQWIAGTWEAKVTPQTGAVVAADYSFNVVSRREFVDALVVETALPALDASSKDPAYLTVRLAPEMVRVSKGGGTVPSTLASKQRPWMASNFRLEIPGLDCSRVRRIEPFRMVRKVSRDQFGQERNSQLVPTTLEFSDVVVTIPEANAETWQQWAKTFLVDGRSDDSQEKTGDLVLLGTDLQSEIARIHLAGLGITSLNRAKGDDNAAGVRSVTATLYCERAALEWKGGAGTVMNVRVFGR